MEKEIVEDAIKQFDATTGFKTKYQATSENLNDIDGLLCITADEKEYCFQVEVKQTINKTIAGQVHRNKSTTKVIIQAFAEP